MTTSNIINLACTIVTALTSVISIIIAVSTLKQTNKITKEANRPYVCASLEYIAMTPIKELYLVIKNYGATGATIKSVSFSKTPTFLLGTKMFENLTNSFIAPGQSISTTGNFKDIDDFIVTIEYVNGKDAYKEAFKLSPNALISAISYNTSAIPNPEINLTLVNTTREIIRNKF